MADERDFELLDDYLTNRMSAQDRAAFEQKLKADPDLQHEYGLQERLIQGIKGARIAELKSMLNQVPVPSGNTGNAVASKIFLGAVATLIIVVAAYWFLKEDRHQMPEQGSQIEEQIPAETLSVPEQQPEIKSEEQHPTPQEKQSADTDKNQTSAGTEHSKPSLAKRPAPLSAPAARSKRATKPEGQVVDTLTPENDNSSSVGNNNNVSDENDQALIPAGTSLLVETDLTNKQYTFHYQLLNGKLLLFGPFEKGTYEILEFLSGGKRTAFLYYSDNYYVLLEADSGIRALTPVEDSALITRLNEHRNSK